MGRLFVVDILVNATGAVLTLLFLLILRLSPAQSDVPPMFPDRPVMWIEVSLAAGGELDRLALRLRQRGAQVEETVLYPRGNNEPLRPRDSIATPFGPWGGSWQGDRLRAIVPCPAPGSDWRLTLHYAATGLGKIESTEATVRVALSSNGPLNLSSTTMTRNTQTGALTQTMRLDPAAIPQFHWRNVSEARCD